MFKRGFKFIDLFAGIGGIRLAFEAVGGTCVFACDIDPDAQLTYYHNFGEKPEGDITRIPAESIPDHDILLAGFPCQAFSIMGNRRGFCDTRGTLYFEIERILRAKKPMAFLLENVKQLATHDGGRTLAIILNGLKQLGYFVHVAILNALDFGVPQKRERVIIVGFRENYEFNFPKPRPNQYNLESILLKDEDVPKKYFASKEIVMRRREKCKVEPFYPSIWHENKSGNVSILPYFPALRASASYNFALVNGVRRPVERELLRAQGFPDDFDIPLCYTKVRKLTGNSVAVPCIKAIAEEMIKSIQRGVILPPAAEQIFTQPKLFKNESEVEYYVGGIRRG